MKTVRIEVQEATTDNWQTVFDGPEEDAKKHWELLKRIFRWTMRSKALQGHVRMVIPIPPVLHPTETIVILYREASYLPQNKVNFNE